MEIFWSLWLFTPSLSYLYNIMHLPTHLTKFCLVFTCVKCLIYSQEIEKEGWLGEWGKLSLLIWISEERLGLGRVRQSPGQSQRLVSHPRFGKASKTLSGTRILSQEPMRWRSMGDWLETGTRKISGQTLKTNEPVLSLFHVSGAGWWVVGSI